jgi:ParB-like chromosome segregation protein Spo0J
MDDLLMQRLNLLETKVKRMEEKLNQLPIPFRLMYRPPGEKEHVNIVQYMDEVDKRLKELERN